jgi:hypothetical protein
MKNKKSKEYKSKYGKMKKVLWAGASTSVLAGMFLVGGGAVIADTIDQPQVAQVSKTQDGMHMMHRWNSEAKAGALAVQLGLSKNDVKRALKSGKPLKQILQENGIVPGQLQKAFESKENSSGKGKHGRNYKKSL